MSGPGDERQDDPRGLAELSALADGTLDPARRQEVEARVAASPELRDRLEQERRAVAMLAAARGRDRAPSHLRARIEAAGGEKTAARAARPLRIGLAGAAVAVAAALALVLPSGTPGAPSVSQAAALGARGATTAAPAPQTPGAPELPLGVGRLRFPNWEPTLGWRATGQRADRLRGRRVLTVYYSSAGHTLAYSIVSGSALPRPSGNYYIQSFRQDGRTVVSWRQGGHTCVLSAAGVPERVLAGLIDHA